MTTRAMPGETASSATCRACGLTFAFHARFYAEKRLKPPALCRECRDARRARLVPGVGQVVQTGRCLVVARAHEKLVVFDLPDTPIGTRLAFVFDPLEEPAPGRLRVARDARVVE